MSIEILIKEPHLDFLESMVERFALSDSREAINLLVTFASKDDPQSNDDFFDFRCVGPCYDNDTRIAMDASTDSIEYLKRMVKQYELDDYATEEERLGKAVRCLINYAEEGSDQQSIFTKGSSPPSGPPPATRAPSSARPGR